MKKLLGLVMVLIVVIIAITSSNIFATNTTYYISSSSGNDSNNGTSSSTPWKTIAKLNTIIFGSGDQILFKCGDSWSGTTFYPQGNGTSSSPILISSYGTGNRPVFTGTENTNVYGIKLQDRNGYKITNLEFGSIPCGISWWANNTTGHDYLWVENCYFHDSTIANHAYYDSSKGKTWVPYEDMYTGTGITVGGLDSTGGNRLLSDITINNCTFYRTECGVTTELTCDPNDMNHQDNPNSRRMNWATLM